MSSSASSRLPFLFPFLLGLFLCYKCTTADTLNHFCGSTGNYTANSTYQSNLDQVLSTLVSKGYRSGFTTANVGQIPDQVYGLVLCRGDVNATACRTCLDGATKDARQLCPFDREAAIWYDDCQLRYSNKLFLNSTDNSDEFLMANTSNVTDVGRFDSLLNQLLSSVTDWAADNSTKRFATGVVNNFTNKFPSIYGLVQCTPDFSGSQCRNCLQSLFNPLPDFLEGKEGGRVIGSRCNMRYEVYSFYEGAPTLRLTAPVNNSAAPPPPLPPPTAAAGGKNSKTGTVLAIVIPLVIGALVISAICIYFWRRRKSARELPYPLKPEEITNVESLFFDFSTLRAATSDFAEQNKLGQGGFGAVYKGLLPDGREIAVKKLLTDSTQGLGELRNELVLVAKLQHRNLVRLLGVSFQEEKLLVYEYVPNRSLDTILFDPEKRGQLDWGIRYKIITGIARGLQYLHEESQVKIVHRDLKASNVLLDADMNPKISDFGFAKLFGGDQTQGTTSRVVGTFGYMAPEYVMHGQYSMKSDIFSFGVMVLEILTGRKNSSQISVEHAGDLLSYTWRKWSSGIAMEILDPVLSDRYSGSEVLRCIQIALLCVQDNPSDRPLMSTVTLMLSSISATVQTPLPPAFYAGRSTKPDSAANDSTSDRLYRSSNNSVVASPNELSISEVEPR